VRTVEQAGVEVLLELPDLEGDGRLGHVQGLGRLGEAEQPGNGVKDLETTVGHGAVPILISDK
jgi:hypothetical protein